DLEAGAAAALEHFLDEPRAGHAVADDYQPFPAAHSVLSSAAAARTAQTLNSGIRLVGSSAPLVSRFAEPAPLQWNGTNTVSSRIDRVTLSTNVASPLLVRSVTARPSESPSLRAVPGCIS